MTPHFFTLAHLPLLFNIHATRVSGGICFLSGHKLSSLKLALRLSIQLTIQTLPLLPHHHHNSTHSAQRPLLSFKSNLNPIASWKPSWPFQPALFPIVSELQNTYALILFSCCFCCESSLTNYSLQLQRLSSKVETTNDMLIFD